MRLPRVLESNSIQITIAVAYTLLLLFTIFFLGTTALVLTRDTLWDTTTYYSEQLLRQVRAGIDTYLGEMDRVSQTLLESQEIAAYLSRPSLESRGDLERLFGTVARMRPDISLLMLAGTTHDPVWQNPLLSLNPAVQAQEQEWYRSALQSGGRAVYSSARVQNLIAGRYRWVVSLSRLVPTGALPADATGAGRESVLLVDLNFQAIEQLARSVQLGQRGYLFITDGEGRIIYHPQQQLIYSDLVTEPVDLIMDASGEAPVWDPGNDPRLYVVDRIDRTDWRVVAVTPIAQLLAGQRQLQSYYLSWVALCFAIVMILTVVVSRRISLPITRLRRTMQAVEAGHFDISVPAGRRDEIGALSRDFGIMLTTVRDLMARNRAEQEAKRLSEIRALQSQISPHFLYNTLDSIVWMAEGGQMQEVIDMTTNLARLLRLSIGRGSGDGMPLVPLSTEIEHLQSYLKIQSMRYRNQLAFEIDIDETCLDCQLPRLTLQPIVENAIYHGIKNRPGGGAVRVTATRSGDLVVAVHDDGPGIDPQILERLRRHEVEPSGGVGLKNVHQRLELTFGTPYGLTLRSEPSHGTTVEIRVPCQEER